MSLTGTTQSIQQLTALLGSLNPLIAAGLTLGKALVSVFKRSGMSEADAVAAAAKFERDLLALTTVSDRIISKGEARLAELDAMLNFNPPKDQRED